jgi:hypothetical protein
MEAQNGNADVEQYGDMILSEAACCRFLRGAKGNVKSAVNMFRTHLEWRVRYKLDTIVDEDFTDLKEHGELYWGGRDKEGVMTLMWRLRKHDAKRTDAKRFVRFFVHQIESGLRTNPDYPNGQFNIGVDLDKVVRWLSQCAELLVSLQCTATAMQECCTVLFRSACEQKIAAGSVFG